jgi:hypothetical protein
VTAGGNLVTAGPGDLGNQPVTTQLGDEARGALAAVTEAVTKAVDEVANVEDDGKEAGVLRLDGIEAGDAFVADGAATAQAVEFGDGLAGRWDVGERGEKACVARAPI